MAAIFIGASGLIVAGFSSNQNVKKKQRVKVIEYFIEVARECFNIGNFNSLMAIIAGLNMSPVSRLKKTVTFQLGFHFMGVAVSGGVPLVTHGFSLHFIGSDSGTKCSRPNSPFWNTRWTHRPISAATAPR